VRYLSCLLALASCLVIVSACTAQEPGALAAKGERLFMAQGCYGCHTVGRVGTPIGPDLTRVGAKYPLAYFERWLRDPAAQRPSAHMPRLELSGEEIEALAAFLAARQ
jgi:cytochrome c oxidase subunit 2